MIWTLGRGCHGGSALFCSTWRRMGRMGRRCLQRSKSGGRLESWVCSVGTSNGAWLLEPGFRLPNPMLLITWLYFSLRCLHTSAWLWFRKHFCIYKIQNVILCISILILSLLLIIPFCGLIEGGCQVFSGFSWLLILNPSGQLIYSMWFSLGSLLLSLPHLRGQVYPV